MCKPIPSCSNINIRWYKAKLALSELLNDII